MTIKFARNNEVGIIQKERDVLTRQDLPETAEGVGLLAFERYFEKTDLVGQGFEDKRDDEKTGRHLLNSAEFPALADQLKVHMQRLAIKGKVNLALEEELFEDEPISVFKKDYEAASGNIFNNKKKQLRKALEAKVDDKNVKMVSDLFLLLDAVLKMEIRAELLIENGLTELQINEGKVIQEIVGIYREFLKGTVIELEAKIITKDLVMPDLSEVLKVVQELGEGGEKLLGIMRKSIVDMERAQIENNEVERKF